MRPRHVITLLLFAAIPVGLAVLLTSGGGTTKTKGSLTQVSLDLLGGGSAGAVSACGIVHHYTVYGSGAPISFRGVISPAGSFKVKLKLKACTGGAFRDSGQAAARIHPGGVYKGRFPAPIAGYYFARVEVTENGALLTRSEKRYFEVR